MEDLRAEIERLERKHQEAPDGRYLVPLATLYRRAGELEAAETLLREALKRRPENLSAHIVLGGCLMDRGRWEEAAAEFRQVLAVDPQNLIALRSLGELARRQGRWVEARRWYEELLAVDPMNEEAQAALQELRSADAAMEAAPLATEAPGAGVELPGGEDGPERATTPAGFDDDLRLTAWDPHAVRLEEPADDETVGPADVEGSELLTETMAELYVQQGHVDKAIGVYRELLRSRNDPALRQRLAELEAEQAHQHLEPAPASLDVPLLDLEILGGETVRFAAEAAAEPGDSTDSDAPSTALAAWADDGGADAFADSFAHGFAGAPAEEGADAAAPSTDASASSFEGLGMPVAPSGTAPPAVAAGAGERPDADGSAPTDESVEGAAGAAVLTVRSWLRRWLASDGSQRAAEGESNGPGVAAPPPAIPELGAPDESTAVVEPAAAAPAPETAPEPWSAPPVTADEPEPWELTPEPGPAPPAGAEERSGFSFSAMLREPTRVPPEETPPAAEPARSDSGDDDLEAFQAWLRSLKR